MKRFFSTLIQIITLLVCIQLARALVAYTLRLIAQPGDNVLLFQALNSLSFVLVGGVLLVCRRPSRAILGLDFKSTARGERTAYWLGGFLVVVLIFISLMLDLRENLANIHFAVVVPIFEELLFRGYVWNKIKNALPEYANGLTLATVTLLFAFWHVGYLDSFLSNPLALHGMTLSFLLATKIVIGIVLGSVAGLIRWRTDKVYGAVLVHAFWNLFA